MRKDLEKTTKVLDINGKDIEIIAQNFTEEKMVKDDKGNIVSFICSFGIEFSVEGGTPLENALVLSYISKSGGESLQETLKDTPLKKYVG